MPFPASGTSRGGPATTYHLPMRIVVLAALAVLAAVLPAAAQPALTFSAAQVHHGQKVQVRGTGFTPRGHLMAHLIRPDGTEYPEMPATADDKGLFFHDIQIVPTNFGSYELLVEDLTTKRAASQRFLLVPLPFAAAVVTQADRLPPAFSGVWEGAATQARTPAPAPSPVVIALGGGRIGAVVGTVAYPAQLCGGELWLVSVSGDAVQLGEKITYGEERCAGRALVTTRMGKDATLTFDWRDVTQNGAAQGTLRKRD